MWRCLVILLIAAACINACKINGYFINTSDSPKINTTVSLPNIPGTFISGAGRQNLSVIPGSNVQLFCPATGIPPANISWHKDQNPYPVNKNVINTTIDGIPTKVITIEQKDNFTEYSCRADSVAGVARSTVSVRTLSKPTYVCVHISYIVNVLISVFMHVSFSQLSTEPIIWDPPLNWTKTTLLLLVIVHVFLSTVVCVLTVAHTKAILCINGVKMVRLLPIPAHQTF